MCCTLRAVAVRAIGVWSLAFSVHVSDDGGLVPTTKPLSYVTPSGVAVFLLCTSVFLSVIAGCVVVPDSRNMKPTSDFKINISVFL